MIPIKRKYFPDDAIESGDIGPKRTPKLCLFKCSKDSTFFAIDLNRIRAMTFSVH